MVKSHIPYSSVAIINIYILLSGVSGIAYVQTDRHLRTETSPLL